MLTSAIYDHDARKRSLAIAAEAMRRALRACARLLPATTTFSAPGLIRNSSGKSSRRTSPSSAISMLSPVDQTLQRLAFAERDEIERRDAPVRPSARAANHNSDSRLRRATA